MLNAAERDNNHANFRRRFGILFLLQSHLFDRRSRSTVLALDCYWCQSSPADLCPSTDWTECLDFGPEEMDKERMTFFAFIVGPTSNEQLGVKEGVNTRICGTVVDPLGVGLQ